MYMGHSGTLPNGDFVAMIPTKKENNEVEYFLRLLNLDAWSRKLSSKPHNHVISINYGCRNPILSY